MVNGNASTNGRKWPVSSYGALSTMASSSPLNASCTPPPTGKTTTKQFPSLFLIIINELR